MHIGIVGHEAAKFTPETRRQAKLLIGGLVGLRGDVIVSGACHLGGVDVWAEEAAAAYGRGTLIFPPKRQSWLGGYKDRNRQIAEASDIVHVIVVAELPRTYTGMRFSCCYHCARAGAPGGGRDHVKSGGCWTAWEAMRLGKPARWHILTP